MQYWGVQGVDSATATAPDESTLDDVSSWMLAPKDRLNTYLTVIGEKPGAAITWYSSPYTLKQSKHAVTDKARTLAEQGMEISLLSPEDEYDFGSHRETDVRPYPSKLSMRFAPVDADGPALEQVTRYDRENKEVQRRVEEVGADVCSDGGMMQLDDRYLSALNGGLHQNGAEPEVDKSLLGLSRTAERHHRCFGEFLGIPEDHIDAFVREEDITTTEGIDQYGDEAGVTPRDETLVSALYFHRIPDEPGAVEAMVETARDRYEALKAVEAETGYDLQVDTLVEQAAGR